MAEQTELTDSGLHGLIHRQSRRIESGQHDPVYDTRILSALRELQVLRDRKKDSQPRVGANYIHKGKPCGILSLSLAEDRDHTLMTTVRYGDGHECDCEASELLPAPPPTPSPEAK